MDINLSIILWKSVSDGDNLKKYLALLDFILVNGSAVLHGKFFTGYTELLIYWCLMVVRASYWEEDTVGKRIVINA